MGDVDLVTWLRCKAANALQLAACYREEAASYEVEARKVDPDGDWSVGCIDFQPTDDLPDNWLEIAELPRPTWREPAKQCETCALAMWSGLGDAVIDCDYGHDGAVDATEVDAWLEHQTGDCPGHTPTEDAHSAAMDAWMERDCADPFPGLVPRKADSEVQDG